MSGLSRTWSVTLALLSASLAFGGIAEARTRTYAIVIAQNRSLDPGVAPLRYADDDGVKTWELLSLFADRSALFVVPDEETTRLHPEAARAAEVPERASILNRLRAFDVEMAADIVRGDEPELFFVYAGHGDVDAGGQGYVNLHDGKLTRGDLFREVIAPSKARFVHVIIDACKSYFMVNSRGGKRKWVDDRVDATEDRHSDAKVRAFLAEEQLENYPRAGVIVATSGDQETHEWSRYQGGILSHELRSGLAGAADVNGDGRIEYSELRAFLAAANSRVRAPEARVEVFSRAPALDRHHALLDLRSAESHTRFLHFGNALSGRFHIEDERGVRLCDLHKERAGTFDVAVSPRRTYYVRRSTRSSDGNSDGNSGDEEAEIRPSAQRRIELSEASWHTRQVASRGALDESFRQDLYKIPFGRGFYDGYVATSGDVPVEEGTLFVVKEPARSGRHVLQLSYLFTSSPAGRTGLSHGVDLRYDYRVWRFVDLGVAAQVGYGSDGSGPAEQSLTRVALLGTIGAEYQPLSWLGLRADFALGWQLFSGSMLLGNTRVEGAEGHGLRLELTGTLAFKVAQPLWLAVRGGLAVDGLYAPNAPSSTAPNGLLALGFQLRL